MGSRIVVALASALVVAGCGGGADKDANSPAAAKAAPVNLASGGNRAVPPASGPPCTHRTRNWRAVVRAPLNPGTGPELSIEGEVEPDRQGRTLGFSHSPIYSRPPLMVIRSDPDPVGETQQWMPTSVSMPDDPAYTQVEVRCGGTVLARLAIARPR